MFGDPIGHSLSPRLHALFAEQVGVTVDYRAILAPPATFSQQVMAFFHQGGVGANITLPHKQRVLDLADTVSDRAQLAGAANTLSLATRHSPITLHADNTDGVGLVEDLQRQIGDLHGARVLILGAGGAVRGIIGSLLEAGCARIALHNRTPANAQAVIDSVVAHSRQLPNLPCITESTLQVANPNANDLRFDVIINGISAGHSGDQDGPFSLSFPTQWMEAIMLGYDMSYGSAAAAFVKHIQSHAPSARTSDGLGMLVGQGAASFQTWTGQVVDSTQALRDLRSLLSA